MTPALKTNPGVVYRPNNSKDIHNSKQQIQEAILRTLVFSYFFFLLFVKKMGLEKCLTSGINEVMQIQSTKTFTSQPSE